MNNLVASFAPQRRSVHLLYLGAMLLLGNIALILSAKVQIGIFPVPFTLQTFALLLIGASYGTRLAGFTVLAYLAEGAIGLPVFAAGGGLVYFTGPTAGYLIGSFFSVLLLGFLCARGASRNLWFCFFTMLLANVVIFTFGVAWLAFGLNIGLEKALHLGLYPFIIPDLAKTVFAAIAVISFQKTVLRHRSP